ncbi:MAG: FAD-binding oxidoreductase [Gammaproteobacteria bacterium]|uniref:NAD(P)/FAD-dependent oxidoreductase n=1 Tax=Rhodoferax sp. TaxID=50421 RepID=UPI0017C702BD|nr:FAD-binding oxidoreductase [Rhodoferax sp.]MBA3059502.1 FAD-binding oxidoreductase [Rhodoferax sp.]MBU3898881.1 FAD-binding oxidoreductase [Gammaproteobacteria bacterium]MBU4081921.1 FAD-binding oxidoreductase [Gammaproteobacteria bacterium]MBU4114870.1 FAD-binding oxidoreductase [Gammaproteobacteria bacterium]
MTRVSTNETPSARTVAIVGAGVVGAATALALAAKGYLVTVIDHGEVGAGTSSGNAGGIVTGAVTPTATPGVLRSIPSYIFAPDGAAVLRPAYSLAVLPWLLRFIAAGRPARVSSIAKALDPLVSKSMQAHLALADLSAARALIRPVGWLKVYKSEAGFAETALEQELMTRHGVNFSILNAFEVADLEPNLNRDSYTRGVFQPESGFVNYPTALTQAYFEAARERQAQYIQESVLEVKPTEGGGISVKTDQATRQFDSVVIAAGAWSKQFAKQLGDKVSLDTERGYHISFASTGGELLRRPVGFPERHCVLSPMHDGISLVSGDELAGLRAPPDYRRIRAMAPFARSVLPGLGEQAIQREWMGYRPSTPDSLPVIGRSPNCKNVFYAFGHGHLGLTLAAITAQLIAGLVNGDAEPFDLSPYRIARF